MSYQKFLRSIEEESIATLRRMVEINSFTFNRGGVNRVGDMCVRLFTPMGFEARAVPSVTPECGDHLFLTREGGSDATAMLLSHLDTVYPPRKVDFPWREDGDRIYGPGVCDIKGGTTVIWMIMRALREKAPALFEQIGFKLLFNATEEGACADFGPQAREYATPDTKVGLVFEAGGDTGEASTVVISRKAAARFRVEATGKEGHSGNAHDRGVSAIRVLARAIDRIEGLTDYERDLTFNVGVARGGTAVNSVPGHAWCLLDMRARTVEDYEKGRDAVLALAGEGQLRSADGKHHSRIDIIELPGYPPWEPNERSDNLGDLVRECGRELGQEIIPVRRKGASDACNLYDLVPTIDGMGPVGRNSHCSVHDPSTGREQESVSRASFVQRALLSLTVIERLFRT
ncbi:MAG: M20/M25/M40 family metallo-hydrolase [Planctomycetota bacterium]|jgi:glutamate carboxypeptidase